MPCRETESEIEYYKNLFKREGNYSSLDNRCLKLLDYIKYLYSRLEIPFSLIDKHIGSLERLNLYTVLLCATLKSLTQEQLEAFVYDGKIKEARQLAEWWEDHQVKDREREELESKAKLK